MTTATSAPRRHLPTSPFKAKEVEASSETFEVGDRVTHDRRGLGRVIRVDAHYITVQFGPSDVARVPQGARGLVRL